MESTKSQWAGRYSWGDENQSNQGVALNGTKILTNFEEYMGSNTRTFSPNIVNEARYGYTRFFNSIGTFLAFQTDVVSAVGIPGLQPGDPVQWGIPNVTLSGDGYTGLGDSTEGPYANDNNTMQLTDTLSIIHGKHTLRMGGEYRRENYNQVGNQFARGQFTFQANATLSPDKTGGNSFAEFLLGDMYQSEAAVAIANARFQRNAWAFYIDDSWKVTSKLTLSLGLRYELTPPFYDTLNNAFAAYIPFEDRTPQVPDLTRYPQFVRQAPCTDPYAGVPIRWPEIDTNCSGVLGNKLVQTDYNDFAPRIGIAYSPSSKWVIRTGVGMFYNQDTGNPRFDLARNLAGRIRVNSTIGTPNLFWSNALASIGGGTANVTNPYAFANKYERRT
ncbi:MAG: TonB-dependent receptor domain-containing protein, partial [Bryobacteraceae bacterium]